MNQSEIADDVAPLVKQLRQYIDISSISGNEAEFLTRLERDFSGAGYQVDRQPVADERWNLLAMPRNPPRLLFCTHVDVVPPHIPSSVKGERVYGRGACDTKGGLVAMMAAANQLDPERKFIGFLLVVGEEVDHIGAIVASKLDLRPEAIVLCEPTEGLVVAGQKGLLKVDLTSTGVAADSAVPDLGKDALGPLLDSLQAVRSADYPDDEVLGPTTVNIGLLSAGVAANITPPNARAELMYRAVSDPDDLFEQVKAMCHPEVDVQSLSSNPPILLNSVEGFPQTNIAFNTDAYYLKGLGDVYLMGPGDIRHAHGDDEHITFEELHTGVRDYVRLVQTILGIVP